jgi:hypothetical protein
MNEHIKEAIISKLRRERVTATGCGFLREWDKRVAFDGLRGGRR